MSALPQPLARSARRPAEPLATLHARFRRPLERYFAGCRLVPADVDDFTQEVFARLARGLPPAELRRPDAFVFTLARNLVRDHSRRLHTRAARQSVALEHVELACGTPTPEARLEHDQRLGRALAALDGLKPAARRAFLLHRVHGFSHAEVAAATGVSVSTIEKHVMAALDAVRAVDD